MVPRIPHEVYEKLMMIQFAGCNCDTKTPVLSYHKDTCRYRLACEIEDLLDRYEVENGVE